MIRFKNIIKNKDISRYFFIYYSISLLIIFIIVFFIQWIVVSWIIYAHEQNNINEYLVNIKDNVTQTVDTQRNLFYGLIDTYHTNITSTNLERIINRALRPNTMFFVFSQTDELIYGQYWEDLSELISYNSTFPIDFYFTDAGFSTYTVLGVTDHEYNFYYVYRYTEPFIPYFYFQTITIERLRLSNDRYHRFLSHKSFEHEFSIYPYDSVFSFGVYAQRDVNGHPAILHIYQYPREVNLFMQRSFFVIIFIFIFSFLILTIFSYNIISKKIFNPISIMVNKMKSISNEPEHITPVNIETHDEILQIFDHFNEMINSINHAKNSEQIHRALELELIRINRLSELGKRIEGVVHNLNSPLNSIVGYAQLLSEEMKGNENINNDLQRIISNGRKMTEMIKLLLHKTRDDSIAMPVPVNINNMLNQELSFCLHDLFFKHNVKLNMKLADNIPDLNLVYGDISQIFQTLFNNAMDAMKDSPVKVLTVASYLSEDYVVFTVEDTGVGMSAEVMDNLFKIGFTTKTQTESSGFGIGLALVKTILDKLKGKIIIESIENKGTEVCVQLKC